MRYSYVLVLYETFLPGTACGSCEHIVKDIQPESDVRSHSSKTSRSGYESGTERLRVIAGEVSSPTSDVFTSSIADGLF